MPVTQLKKNKMKHLHLGIQDDKYNFFVELIKNLNFVKIEYDEVPVAKDKKESVVANIRKGFVDKKAIDKGELKTFPIEDLFDE